MGTLKVGDKIKSPKSLWHNSEGIISGINEKAGLVYVIFKETDRYLGHQQMFDKKDIVLIQRNETK